MSEVQAYVKDSSQKFAYGTSAQQRSAGASTRHLIGCNGLVRPYK